MINQTILNGWITFGVESKETKDGKIYIQNAITVQRNYKDESGKMISDVIGFSAFGNVASFISKYVNKGDRVVARGRLQSSSYTIKEAVMDEDKIIPKERTIYKTEFIIDELDLIQKGKAEEKKESVYEKYEKLKVTSEDDPNLFIG